MNNGKTPLAWLPGTDEQVMNKMFQYKFDCSFVRPSFLDTIAQGTIVKSKRSTCLFYEAGAIIFYGDIELASGYNGAARGDVDLRIAGCARIVGGTIQEGKGLCRGSHAELNAIGNLTTSTIGLDYLQMMGALHPRNVCAKQIVNKKIKKVYYIWEYGREPSVTEYLRGLGVEVVRYMTPYLQRWIERNGYDPIGLRHHEP